MKIKYFKSVTFQNCEYHLAGSSKGGSDLVCDLITDDEKEKKTDPKFVIKIHTKGDCEKKRFEHEIEFLEATKKDKSKNSSYVIDILDSGTILYNESEKECCFEYYIMPKVNCSFKDIIRDCNMTVKNKLKYYLQLCGAVKFLHDKNIVHRDIKPDNILFDSIDNKIKLCDFGIAHFPDYNLTEEGDRLANANYCAPEQRIKGGIVGKHSDIYALGLLLNELFTNEVAHGEKYVKIRDICPDLFGLDDIVTSMIQYDFKKRESDINAVIVKIKDFIRIYDLQFAKYYKHAVDNHRDKKSKMLSTVFAKDNLTLLNNVSRKDFWNLLNINYHRNMHCTISSENFKKELELAKIRKILEDKFNYECNGLTHANFDKSNYYIDECDEEIFLAIISEYKELMNEDYGLAIHYFYSINYYHAKEAITAIQEAVHKMREDFLDSPMFYIAKMAFDLLDNIEWSNFGLLVKPIFTQSDTVCVDEYITMDASANKDNCIQLIRGLWPHSTIIAQDTAIKIIMTPSQYNQFQKMSMNYSSSLPESDVRAIDIEDMLNTKIKRNKKIIFWLFENDYQFLVPKILKAT